MNEYNREKIVSCHHYLFWNKMCTKDKYQLHVSHLTYKVLSPLKCKTKKYALLMLIKVAFIVYFLLGLIRAATVEYSIEYLPKGMQKNLLLTNAVVSSAYL